ncbi:MAG: glycine--tRNA ligase subunit beta, partial [Planctomycetota bacterium]
AVADLEVRETEKGPYVFATKQTGGAAVAELIPALCAAALAAIPFPKSMVWGVGMRFARPIRSMCLLLDGEVIETTMAGVTTGRAVEGHPFLHDGPVVVERAVEGHPFLHDGPVVVERADWDHYREQLRTAKVLLDTDERRTIVRDGVAAVLGAAGATAPPPEALVDEVANLVQWPSPITAEFDAEFLAVPDAVIDAAMTEHQRYFPVPGADGALTNRFVVVADRPPASAELIGAGNARVLRARLADARFFYDLDRKRSLLERVGDLGGMGEQPELGNLRDRAGRLATIATAVAGAERSPDAFRALSADDIRTAALCAKADLTTEMVGEFPSLQGVIGAIYAREQGLPDDVADAIEHHYRPKGTSDAVPAGAMARCLGLSDRALSIMEAFALGREPTGSKDPFGVRRASLGLLRLVRAVGAGRVDGLLYLAADAMPAALKPKAMARRADAEAFVADRLAHWAREEGVAYDTARAVAAVSSADVVDFFARCAAVEALRAAAEWETLVAVTKRTANILKKAEPAAGVNPALLGALNSEGGAAEHALQAALQSEEAALLAGWTEASALGDPVARAARYTELGLHYGRTFAPLLERYFDAVFVMDEDLAVRRNRLAALAQVNRLFSTYVADLSRIEGDAAADADAADGTGEDA